MTIRAAGLGGCRRNCAAAHPKLADAPTVEFSATISCKARCPRIAVCCGMAALLSRIEPTRLCLVDEQEGAIRGFACAYLEADPEWGCLLDNLHVVPDLKGKGLGRQLMTAVAQQVWRSNPSGRLHLCAYEQNSGRAGSMSGWAGPSPCATPSSRPTERK